ncbi:hypothetical protein CGRA01v4_11348 [Colletotrichum graminicola]|nr:hypothetical protein CGRA01v4_11348 [Colletotrichum graminicola]
MSSLGSWMAGPVVRWSTSPSPWVDGLRPRSRVSLGFPCDFTVWSARAMVGGVGEPSTDSQVFKST